MTEKNNRALAAMSECSNAVNSSNIEEAASLSKHCSVTENGIKDNTTCVTNAGTQHPKETYDSLDCKQPNLARNKVGTTDVPIGTIWNQIPTRYYDSSVSPLTKKLKQQFFQKGLPEAQ